MVFGYGCGKCSLPIGAWEGRITCDGCCNKEYHLSCTKMNPYQLRVCVEFANVLWMCDECLSSFRKQRSASTNDEANTVEVERDEKNESLMERTVSQLQCEIATIRQDFVELKQSLNSGSQRSKAIVPSTSTPQNCSSLQRTTSSNEHDTSRLLMGKNAETPSAGPRRFWLFFTRVAKHVSTDAMREMVSNALRLNVQPEVIKLMPRWSNYDDLRYVSFKVGVDWEHKKNAIKESTWPKGLLFREFEHRETSYWEP